MRRITNPFASRDESLTKRTTPQRNEEISNKKSHVVPRAPGNSKRGELSWSTQLYHVYAHHWRVFSRWHTYQISWPAWSSFEHHAMQAQSNRGQYSAALFPRASCERLILVSAAHRLLSMHFSSRSIPVGGSIFYYFVSSELDVGICTADRARLGCWSRRVGLSRHIHEPSQAAIPNQNVPACVTGITSSWQR